MGLDRIDVGRRARRRRRFGRRVLVAALDAGVAPVGGSRSRSLELASRLRGRFRTMPSTRRRGAHEREQRRRGGTSERFGGRHRLDRGPRACSRRVRVRASGPQGFDAGRAASPWSWGQPSHRDSERGVDVRRRARSRFGCAFGDRARRCSWLPARRRHLSGFVRIRDVHSGDRRPPHRGAGPGARSRACARCREPVPLRERAEPLCGSGPIDHRSRALTAQLA